MKRLTKKKTLEQVNLDYPELMDENFGLEKLEFFRTENPVETEMLMPISIHALIAGVQAHPYYPPTPDLHIVDDIDLQPWPPPLALLSPEHIWSSLFLTKLTSLSKNHSLIPRSYLPIAYLLQMSMLRWDLMADSVDFSDLQFCDDQFLDHDPE